MLWISQKTIEMQSSTSCREIQINPKSILSMTCRAVLLEAASVRGVHCLPWHSEGKIRQLSLILR